MTTMTISPDLAARNAVPAQRATFADTLDAEWTKLRTVRSTLWTLVSLVVVSVGLSGLLLAAAADDLARGEAEETPASFLTFGLTFGQVAALVLGVLIISSEYSTGMIRTTLAASPRRLNVLAAKGIVLGTVLFVLGTVTAFASYFVGNAFLSANDIGVDPGDPGVLRALLGGGLYMAGLGLLGYALALVLRHTAAAITVGLATIFVASNLVALLPGSFGDWAYKVMPGNAGPTVATIVPFDPNLLAAWTGFGVFMLEVAALVALGALLFTRRDA